MPDDMDFVQAINEQFIDDCLAKHKRRTTPPAPSLTTGGGAFSSPPSFQGGAGGWCIDCGDEIPVKRRQAQPGCTRCIDCQTPLEQWRPL